VRKAGDTVRISAQLIDASTDQHLWSQTFDRPLNTANLFAMQDEIAKSIVDHLAATMGSAADVAGPVARKADTADEDAYDLYLKGRSLFIARTRENLAEAARILKVAVAKDPKFARAWEMLGAVLVTSKSWDVGDERDYQAGVDAVDTALRLDPNLSLAYAVRGEVQVDMIPSRGAVGWEDSSASYCVQSTMMGQMLRPTHGAVKTTQHWGIWTAPYRTTSDVRISIPPMKAAGYVLR
jgi:hypothetical protein